MKLAANNATLRIAVGLAEDVDTWTLCGGLSGRMSDGLARSWKNARSQSDGREFVVNLIEVTSVDERGEQVPMEMTRKGVRFIVRGLYLTILLEDLRERCKQENERCGSFELR